MKNIRILSLVLAASAALPLSAQTYSGTPATGYFILSRTVDLQQLLKTQSIQFVPGPEPTPKNPGKLLHPPIFQTFSALAYPVVHGLTVSQPLGSSFAGLNHADQRNAANGNQFSVEPPNPSVAMSNSKVLEGVNNAIQVYTTAGVPLLARPIATNELFGVTPAIDRGTGVNGVYPTDMRVFYDAGIDRWIVLQRSQDNDIFGNPLASSHMYMAVSKTNDPTAVYNVYIANSTDTGNGNCPCVADYPQIGADQYGFYIATNEFNSFSQFFVNASILAISKSDLQVGTVSPKAARFVIPFSSGYEFAIQPATTPPGASNFLASGGVEFFASSTGSFANGSAITVWAMSNTSSLLSATPAPVLSRATISTLPYYYPDAANQPEGPRPYGNSIGSPLPFIDGGDIRTLSLSYAGGRLHLTLSTKVLDEAGNPLVGAAHVILSPSLRSGVLSAPVFRQGYLAITRNHLLRPSVAVNAQGRGAIAVTVVGPDYYPSAGYIPVDTAVPSSLIKIPGIGTLPEDGFTGYQGGVARWGDYCSAMVASDGSVWMVAEYVGSPVRTDYANWQTLVMAVQP